jgi:serine/threonine protein kinase
MTHYGEETGRILSNSQHPKVSATSLNDDFEVGVTLGTGSFGRVRFATHKDTTTQWAVKVLKKSEVVRLQQVEHVISEKTILDQCKHPFIVHLACTFQG